MHPFLITVGNDIAGFILLTEKPYVKEGSDYCIQEFFVMNKFRKQSVGKQVFKILSQKYKGGYCLTILKDNIATLNFGEQNYEKNGIKYNEGELDNEQCYHEFVLE